MCGRYFVVLAVMTSLLFLGPKHMAVEQQTSVKKKAEKSFSVQLAQLSPEEKKALKEKSKQAKRRLDKLKKLQKQKARGRSEGSTSPVSVKGKYVWVL